MRNYKLLPVWLVLAASFIQCGLPSKPDFTTSHKVEAPILFNKTFQFLGGGEGETEALLDTTKADFDSLFTVIQNGDNEGLVTISKTEEFEFGDLNDAIPAISAEAVSFSSKVGEIELGSFSSGGGNLGSVNIEDVLGSSAPSGTPIPAGDNSANPVKINIGSNTDFFVSATIKSGRLELEVTNTLGFDFERTVVQLVDTVTNETVGSPAEFSEANGNKLVDTSNNPTSQKASVEFLDGDRLKNLGVELIIEWNAFSFPDNPQSLVVNNANGVDLTASRVVAAVTSQDFSTTSTSTFDATEFQFTSEDHYVELESGSIKIAPIVNGLDLTIESLVISFPKILAGPNYDPGDSLVISYTGLNQITRKEESIAQNIDLSGYRLYALNNQITYNISALTEDTQAPGVPQSEQNRVISEDDSLASSVEITDLKISSATGQIAAQTVLLGDDDPNNNNGDVEIVDLYNDTEVSLTTIDGLEDLSSEIDGIELSDATLTISYSSNIGISTTIYAAILGVNGDGEELYLKGIEGTEREVTALDSVSGITANGTELDPSQMIKFTLEPSTDGSTITSSIIFDDSNTNVNDFLNNLPNEIRFVGKSVINKDGGTATIATPLEFDPTFVVDLPIFFQADGASYSTTEEVTAFEDFPTEEDDLSITVGELIIGYKNGFPFGVTIELDFLNDSGASEVSVPRSGDDPLVMEAGEVNSITRFVEAEKEGQLIISMDYDQLKNLYKADSLAVTATLNTFNNEAVKVRDKDAITINLSGNFTIENTISNN